MPKLSYITPNCCKEAKSNAVILRGNEWKSDEDVISIAPKWIVKIFEDEKCGYRLLETTVEAKFCPFCGKKLPDLELNYSIDLSKIYKFDDNYCANCNKRNSDCSCLQPEFKWKIVE